MQGKGCKGKDAREINNERLSKCKNRVYWEMWIKVIGRKEKRITSWG
jgi:hypothetical protein